jgi:hypothetical protein
MIITRKTTLLLRHAGRFVELPVKSVLNMPNLDCRLFLATKEKCASFAPDKDSSGKLIFNQAITLKDIWAKEAQKI